MNLCFTDKEAFSKLNAVCSIVNIKQSLNPKLKEDKINYLKYIIQ